MFGSLSFVFDKSAGISLAIERVGVSRVRVRYVSEVLSRGGLRVVFQRECLGLREGEEEQRPERERVEKRRAAASSYLPTPHEHLLLHHFLSISFFFS